VGGGKDDGELADPGSTANGAIEWKY